MGCEICDEDHAVETCNLIGHCTPVDDTSTTSYARLSLPAGLKVKDLIDGNKTVITTKKFFRGAQFGPFKAVPTPTLAPNVLFPLKIFLKNGDEVFLKTDEECFSNWMCLVTVATCKEEINMYCYQVNENIYYSVIVDVLPGTELKVWYAPHYAKLLNADPLPSDTSQMELDVDEVGMEPIGDHQYVNKKKKKNKKQQALKLNKLYKRVNITDDCGLSEEMKKKLPMQLLGVLQPRNEWKCALCKVVEPSVSQYASHLIHHLKLQYRRRCKHCKNKVNGKHERLCKINLYMKGMSDGSDLTEEERNSIKKQKPVAKNKNKTILLDVTNDLKTVKTTESAPQNIPNKDVKSVSETNKQTDSILNCDKDNDLMQTESTNGKNLLMEFLENGMWNIDNASMDNVISSNEGPLDSNSSLKERQLDLPPPILDLSDELEFQSLKNFTDIDKQFSRNADFFDNVSENLLNSVDGISATDQFPLFSLDKSEFLEQKFENLLEVTDEEKNRLVENLLKETEERMSDSVYEVDNGMKEGEVLLTQQEKSKESEAKQDAKKENERTIACDICKKKFTEPKYLMRHLKKHTGEFSCKYCMNIFARKETLLSHKCLTKSSTETDVRKERCGICSTVFFSHQELLFHVGQHYCTDSKWKCTFCFLIADDTQDLDKHECTQSNSNERQVSCSNCNKLFSTNNDFIEHRENINIEKLKVKREDKIVCEKCGAFVKKKLMRQHQLRCPNNEKRFQCEKCGSRFHTEQNLENHEKNHPPPPKHYSCSICEKKIKNLKNFKRHVLLHSSIQIACVYCDKKFSYKQNYQQHLLTHLKPPKEFKCDECETSFTCNHQRQKHMSTCSKKTIDCTACKKEALKHILNDFEYICRYCKTVLKYRQSLMRHLNHRHGDHKEDWQVKSVIESMKVFVPKKSGNEHLKHEKVLHQAVYTSEGLPTSGSLNSLNEEVPLNINTTANNSVIFNEENVLELVKSVEGSEQALLESEIVTNSDLITLHKEKLMDYVDSPLAQDVPVVLSKNELLEMVNSGSLLVTSDSDFTTLSHNRLQDIVNSVSPVSVTNQDRLLDLVNESCNVSVPKDLILSKGGILELVGSTIPNQGQGLAGLEQGVTVNVLWTNADSDQQIDMQAFNGKTDCVTPMDHLTASDEILGLNIENNFNNGMGTLLLEDGRIMEEDVQLGGDILLYVVEQPADEQELQFV